MYPVINLPGKHQALVPILNRRVRSSFHFEISYF